MELEILKSLGISIAIGLLIGLERGWHARKQNSQQRVGGFRTYGLLSLSGGLSALVSKYFYEPFIAFSTIMIVAILIAAYVQSSNENKDFGITSVVASFIAFILGSLSLFGYADVAASLAVIVSIVLGFKPMFHSLLAQLGKDELNAILKLLLISVVILPILPNQTYGPLNVLNPYEIWMMVVLITAISLIGYFAVKFGGSKKGIVITGIAGGLIASTIVTLNLSKLQKSNVGSSSLLASGILAACATMFPRILLVATAISPMLFKSLVLPISVMATITYIGAFLLWYNAPNKDTKEEMKLENPFELMTALKFTLLLVVILFASKAFAGYVGDAGVYLLSIASGVTDVDAITLSLSRLTTDNTLTLNTAIIGILIAANTNNMVKTGMSFFIGSKALALRVGAILGLAGIAGFISLLF